MILEDKYFEEIEQYCKMKKIPLIKGKIPAQYINEIQGYIQQRLKSERAVTRRLQEDIDLKVSTSVFKIMEKLGVQMIVSPIEVCLWDALERAELSFLAKRQFGIGPYKIDIAFPKHKLAVECDGREYHRENQLQLERDQKRDKYLAYKGWRTLRIEGIAIRRDINYCVDRIKQSLGLAQPAI